MTNKTPTRPTPPSPPQWVVITPAEALLWMETRNLHNRPLDSKRSVITYSRDMLAGRWEGENGEGIKFGKDDEGRIVLLDGQHRLAAIVLAGVPVGMWVYYNVPMKSQRTIDRGRKRTTSQQFHLDGHSNSSNLSAVLRRICLWDAGCYLTKGADLVPSEPELYDALDLHPESVESASFGVSHKLTGMPPSIIGFSHWLLCQVNAENGQWFMERVTDGISTDRESLTKGHPILVLRDKIDRANVERFSRRGPGLTADELVAHTISAYNSWKKHETRAKYQIPPGGLTNDNFPMPRR